VSIAATGSATAHAIKEQARRLGLQWQLVPGTVDVGVDSTVILDGSGGVKTVTAIPLQGPLISGDRVMCLLLPSDGNVYVIGTLGAFPTPGELVAKLRQVNAQTTTTAVGVFINFDTIDYDPWLGFNAATPDRWVFPFPGIFLCNARVVYVANAVSRRGCFIGLDGSTSGANTLGGASLQTPAAGTCQIGCVGTGNVQAGEYVGVQALQTSGGNLDTSNSNGGSLLEVIYLGQSVAA
jgi:hypothetical protein